MLKHVLLLTARPQQQASEIILSYRPPLTGFGVLRTSSTKDVGDGATVENNVIPRTYVRRGTFVLQVHSTSQVANK